MKNTQGSIVIYIVLLMFIVMTSAAIVLSSILTRHIRAAENYLITEQSFAAANSSIEHMLYRIAKQNAVTEAEVADVDSISYGPGVEVAYNGTGCAVLDIANNTITPHLTASGTYKDVVRRIEFGGGVQDCEQP